MGFANDREFGDHGEDYFGDDFPNLIRSNVVDVRAVDYRHANGKKVEVKSDFSSRAWLNNGCQVYFTMQRYKEYGGSAGPWASASEAEFFCKQFCAKRVRGKLVPRRRFLFRTKELVARCDVLLATRGDIRVIRGAYAKKYYLIAVADLTDIAIDSTTFTREISQVKKS
jgi:hypothetical protein